MSVVKDFVLSVFWVNVPVAIFFLFPVKSAKVEQSKLVCLFVYTQRAEQVTLFCRQQVEYSDDDEPKQSVRLSEAQKLRKVIIELVDTERSYVKVNKNDLAALTLR